MPEIRLLQDGWDFAVSIVVALAAFAGIVWKLGQFSHEIGAQAKDADKRFTAQGERIGTVERLAGENRSGITAVEKLSQKQEFTIHGLERNQTEIASKLDHIMAALDSRAAQRHREDTDLATRLARIETQLEISNQLREIANQITARNGSISHG